MTAIDLEGGEGAMKRLITAAVFMVGCLPVLAHADHWGERCRRNRVSDL